MTLPVPPLEGGHGMDKDLSVETRLPSALNKSFALIDTDTNDGLSAPSSSRSSLERTENADSRRSSLPREQTKSSRPKDVILKAFLPRVAVYASSDTEELVRLKNIYGGLCGLLRPFGETICGKVGIRDSSGSSKSWDDYGVHFFALEKGRQHGLIEHVAKSGVENSFQEEEWSKILRAAPEDNLVESALDEVIRHQLNTMVIYDTEADAHAQESSPLYYDLFLRKMLSERSLSPYETFSHPIACVIAISSQNPDPIGTLGDLYQDTRAETGILPPWVNNGFLRYYVLVHDEDHDDISTSTALFAQMKRNFGLHCHLLRLRSKQCTIGDPEVSPLPLPQWSTADEDAANIHQHQGIEPSETRQCIYDSDAAVIRSFVRELVTQSIVPYMESRVTLWNEQVASKRRGMTGRLMSISKRWTSFGSVRGTAPSAAANRDYDNAQCAYKSESAIATMHRLADYAFMLRDWKLSSSIYDLLRADFSDDKAWHHFAEAHQMAAVSLLVGGHNSLSRVKIESINQLLDTASYSFITRCNSPREAVNCMIMAMELFNVNGGLSSKEAVRWGKRLLELSIMSPISQVLIAERLSLMFSFRDSHSNAIAPESPCRRNALWSLLAAQVWIKLDMATMADKQLRLTKASYDGMRARQKVMFDGTQDYLDELNQNIKDLTPVGTGQVNQGTDTFIENLEPTSNADSECADGHLRETMHIHRRGRSQQISIGGVDRTDNHLTSNDDGFS